MQLITEEEKRRKPYTSEKNNSREPGNWRKKKKRKGELHTKGRLFDRSKKFWNILGGDISEHFCINQTSSSVTQTASIFTQWTLSLGVQYNCVSVVHNSCYSWGPITLVEIHEKLWLGSTEQASNIWNTMFFSLHLVQHSFCFWITRFVLSTSTAQCKTYGPSATQMFHHVHHHHIVSTFVRNSQTCLLGCSIVEFPALSRSISATAAPMLRRVILGAGLAGDKSNIMVLFCLLHHVSSFPIVVRTQFFFVALPHSDDHTQPPSTSHSPCHSEPHVRSNSHIKVQHLVSDRRRKQLKLCKKIIHSKCFEWQGPCLPL